MRPLRAAPLACCMYCLATGTPRTDEHLIPQALGGRLVLRDAVCETCRRITGRLEQQTLEREFVVPKTLLALKRRRARGQGPSRLPPVTLVGAESPSLLTAETFPRGFSLPAFESAGALAGVDRTHTPPRVDFIECRLNLGTPTRWNIAAPPTLPDPRAYAYAIAKWAYALAVAERGLACCDTQSMRDLLLLRRGDVFAFVGTPSPRESASREWLHAVSLREDGERLIVRLALFASGGMTSYEVVVGEVRTGLSAATTTATPPPP